jgi:hypothetical protein
VSFNGLYNVPLQHFSFKEEIRAMWSQMYIGVRVKYPWFLSDWNLLDRFSQNIWISNFMKIRPVAADLFQAERQTDMTKLIVTFHNLLNARKNNWIIEINTFINILNCYKTKQQWILLSNRIHVTVLKCNQKNINYKCHFWKVQTGRTIPARKTTSLLSFNKI